MVVKKHAVEQIIIKSREIGIFAAQVTAIPTPANKDGVTDGTPVAGQRAIALKENEAPPDSLGTGGRSVEVHRANQLRGISMLKDLQKGRSSAWRIGAAANNLLCRLKASEHWACEGV